MKLELFLYIFASLNIYTIQDEIDVDISNKSPIARDAKSIQITRIQVHAQVLK